jgi:hypothetical protein
MEKKRVFRNDYVSLHKAFKFNSGDIATILEEDKPNISFKVDEKPYQLPYRDFMVTTKQII